MIDGRSVTVDGHLEHELKNKMVMYSNQTSFPRVGPGRSFSGPGLVMLGS